MTEIEHLRNEVADYKRSVALYDKASRALMHAYKAAHPEVPENVWPDATMVNVWAAAEIERLRASLGPILRESEARAAELARITSSLGQLERMHQFAVKVNDDSHREIERLRVALDDIATSDPTMDDARALVSVAKVALAGGRA